MVRVLITGATGFTGGHLARALSAEGHRVRALVRDPAVAGDLAAAGIELAPGDLRDKASLERAVAGVEVVYHIAAIYRQAGVSSDTYRSVNARGLQRSFRSGQSHEGTARARQDRRCSSGVSPERETEKGQEAEAEEGQAWIRSRFGVAEAGHRAALSLR